MNNDAALHDRIIHARNSTQQAMRVVEMAVVKLLPQHGPNAALAKASLECALKDLTEAYRNLGR